MHFIELPLSISSLIEDVIPKNVLSWAIFILYNNCCIKSQKTISNQLNSVEESNNFHRKISIPLEKCLSCESRQQRHRWRRWKELGLNRFGLKTNDAISWKSWNDSCNSCHSLILNFLSFLNRLHAMSPYSVCYQQQEQQENSLHSVCS